MSRARCALAAPRPHRASPGHFMVLGSPEVLLKMASARRYKDADYIGATTSNTTLERLRV
jgi:hypothetical protein